MRLLPSLSHFLTSSLTLSAIFTSVSAVYQDEAYTLDYSHTLLGLPLPKSTFFHQPRKNDKASLLYTLSDVGVLGAVNPGTGEIVWRQFLDDSLNNKGNWTGGSVAPYGEVIVTSVADKVAAWDALSGKIRWENEFPGTGRHVHVLEAIDAAVNGDVVALSEAEISTVRKLDGRKGDVLWEYALEAGDIPVATSSNPKRIFVVSLSGSVGTHTIKVTSLDVVTGSVLDIYTLTTSIAHSSQVLFVGNAVVPIIVWADKSLSVQANVLGTKTSHHLRDKERARETIQSFSVHAPAALNSQPFFLLRTPSSADVFKVGIERGTIDEQYGISKLVGAGAVSASNIGEKVFFTINKEDEVVVVQADSSEAVSTSPVDGKRVGVKHAAAEVVKTKDNTYAVRTAVVTAEDDWVMVRNGAVAWSRPEGLTKAIQANWAEIPEAETLARELEAEADSNPVSAYIHRVKRHLNDLKRLPAFLVALPERITNAILPGDAPLSSDTLTRDTFGFRKIVVVATGRGRVYALDSANQGEVLWSKKVATLQAGENWNVKALWADKKGRVTVLGDSGELINLSAVTGAVVDDVEQSNDSSTSQQILATITKAMTSGTFATEQASNETTVVRGPDGNIQGLGFKSAGAAATSFEKWTFQAPQGETVYSVVTRPIHDPVASIGHVLADRTVLYKYINPNLVLVTTTSSQASSVSFYLLDSGLGSVLYSTTIQAVDLTKPITSLLSSNTFVYTLFSDVSTSTNASTAKGHQLYISEIFESPLTNNRGPLSSSPEYSPLLPYEEPTDEPHLPHIVTLSFQIPEPISILATTSTLQGITTKSLLAALPFSSAIVSLPRYVIDARRPAGRPPTKGEQEEGLMPYSPSIDFESKFLITHKRPVIGVRGIITEPAAIESTSLVFAYGIDVFGTRVSPSGTFDVLGKGFNKISLVGTVVGLGVATALMAPFVRMKMIDGRWKSG